MTTKKATTGSSGKSSPSAKKTGRPAEGKSPSRRTVSLPKSGKDPKGGLTAEGRRIYNAATGGNLKKGVQGKADTPEKQLRKGSFLRRHFANPPGPVMDEHGQPTRQALEAAAWGEPVPKNEADELKLAKKGTDLLERYHASKGEVKTSSGRWKAAAKQGKSASKEPAAKPSKASGGSSSKSASAKTRPPK